MRKMLYLYILLYMPLMILSPPSSSFIPSSGILAAYPDPNELASALGIYLIAWLMVTLFFLYAHTPLLLLGRRTRTIAEVICRLAQPCRHIEKHRLHNASLVPVSRLRVPRGCAVLRERHVGGPPAHSSFH